MATNTIKQQINRELQKSEQGNLSLDELIAVIQKLLTLIAPVQTRYKVSEIPDSRTIRYYISQGLMPKPLNYSGGRANYDNTHVLTLLFIKKMQAAHFSLRQIKQKLEHYAKQYQHSSKGYKAKLLDSIIEDESERNPTLQPLDQKKKTKKLPARLAVTSAIEGNIIDCQKAIMYKLGTHCTVYVSDSAFTQQKSVSEIAMALRKLAEQLEASL